MHSINNEFLRLKELASQNRLLFSKHFSVVRKNERRITNDEVKWAIVSGLIFEEGNGYKAVYKFAQVFKRSLSRHSVRRIPVRENRVRSGRWQLGC